MLVLRRFCGQSIVIGKKAEIVVKVLREENGAIVLGIDAPQDIQVDRLEIFEKRKQALPPLSEFIPKRNESQCSLSLRKCI